MASSWVLGAAALLLLGCVPDDQTRGAEPADNGRRQFVPGEYIVTVQSGGNADTVGEVYASYGIEKLEPLGRGRFLIRLARDPGLAAARRAGLASRHVAAVERNFVYRYQR